MIPPRVVMVSRPTEYEELLARHGTRDQVGFFLKQRGRDPSEVELRNRLQHESLDVVRSSIPTRWRTASVGREDLATFLFEPGDVVVVVGQDGLVANVAKYLEGQAVVGVNPDPTRNPGVLVRFAPSEAGGVLVAAASGRADLEYRSMVEARLDDGQLLRALNEIFVGHRSHQSARYVLGAPAGSERQSSSGLIVATGTGATGWALSIARQRALELSLPGATDDQLVYFVREPWPSPATGCSVQEGLLSKGAEIRVTSEMGEGGVAFGDGIEKDWLEFRWGQALTITLSETKLALVAA
jgi:NAD kinase